MVSGGMSCVKYLLFCFNLVYAITGIALSTLGIIVHTVYYHYSDFVDRNVQSVPVILIIVGAIIFCVAFFGCCGSVKENHCMVITYSLLILILITLESAVGIAGYVRRAEMKTMMENRVNNTMYEYPTHPGIRKSWNIMQHELECCGMNGPADWYDVFNNNTLPHTCCPNAMNDGSCTTEKKKYEQPCLSIIENTFTKYASIIGAVSITVGMTQLIGFVFSCCLARSIRKEYETV